MAVGGAVGEFDIWLNEKLLTLNADESIFGSYIRGILEGDESLDDKTEALRDLLSEMTEDNIPKLCQEIIEQWTLLKEAAQNSKVLSVSEDVDVKLARLMESQAGVLATKNSNYTADEKRIREAIINNYSQLSDEENDETNPSGGNDAPIHRNTNASAVAQAEKEKREQAKLESQRKKDKDKEDREKQKQMQAEKKEKRKPQKGERRR